MPEVKLIFPLSEIQTVFLRQRNEEATALVKDAVRQVALSCNVPPNIQVAPNEALTALVVVAPPEQPQVPRAPSAPEPPKVESVPVESVPVESSSPQVVEVSGAPV